MPLLEFMQPFDGRQSPLSPEEQERAANLFHATLGNLMLEHVPYVTRYLPLILGDRAPRLHLRPLDVESILQKAEIGLAYNEDQEVRAFTKLHF
ncbi:MAG TPA: hypothetical protein VLA92_03815, partial [Candidatus Saccharimonadales bacterium]|nr:hypothetical protein [Candidatus Saccharimonadales bacterium]